MYQKWQQHYNLSRQTMGVANPGDPYIKIPELILFILMYTRPTRGQIIFLLIQYYYHLYRSLNTQQQSYQTTPVLLDFRFDSPSAGTPQWRLNTSLLSIEAFCSFIKDAIENFLCFNRSEEPSSSLLQESLKATIRGQIISYSSHNNKLRRQMQTDIMNKLSECDRQYAINPTPELYKQKVNLQTQFDLSSTGKAEQTILRSRDRLYEYGDKASRLLALQLKTPSSITTHPSNQRSVNWSYNISFRD